MRQAKSIFFFIFEISHPRSLPVELYSVKSNLFELGHLVTIAEGNGDMDATARRARRAVLTVMRMVEDMVNRGTLPDASRRSGDDQNHLVSTVSVTTNFTRLEVRVSMFDNIDLRQLDDRWRGQNVQRLESNTRVYQQSGDYLTTFTFPENLIVVRFIHEDQELYYSSETQIIWNSAFTWREIQQHLENNTYNFVFRDEIIDISMTNDIITSTNQEEEAANSLRVAVDGLPEKTENSDERICSICHENFSNEQPAKQLSCEHLYHSECIFVWFCLKKACPTCRNEPAIVLA